MSTDKRESNQMMAFKVMMHRELEDQLDEGLSPMDGVVAINDVKMGLPLVHPPGTVNRRRKTLRVHTAKLSWSPMAIKYVQMADKLHILDMWCDDRLAQPDGPKVDAVIPEMPLRED